MPPYKVGSREVYLVGDRPDEWPMQNLAPGEVQDYVALKKECKANGTRFVDKTFDPDSMDIVGRNYQGQYPFSSRPDGWKRPLDENKDSKFSVRDEKGNRYGHADVFQGQLGDCFHLAALAIVADNPKLVNFAIPEDNNEDEDVGIFHFRFWKHGYFFDVVIDDRLPYFWGEPVAAKPNGNEIWPCLIEKAYAKLYGNYAAISGGSVNDSLEDFTGGLIDSQELSRIPFSWEALDPKGKLTQVFAGLGTFNQPDGDTRTDPRSGLYYSHAYSILGREELKTNSGQTVRLLKIRNPHGKSEWIGAWSDYPRPSAEWDTVSQADRDRLLNSKNDGEFWMAVEDVSNTTFQVATYCYWLDNLEVADPEAGARYTWQEIHGEWKSPNTSGLGAGWAKYATLPQYRVNLQHVEGGSNSPPGQAAIVLELLKKGEVSKNPPEQFHCEIFKINNEELLKVDLPYGVNTFQYGNDLTQNTKIIENIQSNPLQSARERFTGVMTEEGAYLIIPVCTPGTEARFLLRIVSEGAGKITAAPPPPPAPEGEKVEPERQQAGQQGQQGGQQGQQGQQGGQPQANFGNLGNLRNFGFHQEDPFSYRYDPYNPFNNANNIPYYNNWNTNGGFQLRWG